MPIGGKNRLLERFCGLATISRIGMGMAGAIIAIDYNEPGS
jgi:hypothetical protein